jgi:hypothetical protein
MRLILEGDAHPPVIICHAAEFMPAPRARVEPDLRLAESSVALKPGDAILPAGSRPPHRGPVWLRVDLETGEPGGILASS